jgi:AcrR family transcriptional regulator
LRQTASFRCGFFYGRKNERVHFKNIRRIMTTSPQTAKAEQTRQRIFDTAVRLFIEKGYEATTLRDIANAADCSLGLAYRYFTCKEDFVIALYRRNAALSEGRVQNMPPAPLAQRFHDTMRGMLDDVTPHRAAYMGVFGSAMNPQSPVGVLGEHTADIRAQMQSVFDRVVLEASDAPKQPQAGYISSLLYSAHFLILLFWINDHTPDCQATAQLLDFSRDALNMLRPALVLPPISRSLARMAGILQAVFGGGES